MFVYNGHERKGGKAGTESLQELTAGAEKLFAFGHLSLEHLISTQYFCLILLFIYFFSFLCLHPLCQICPAYSFGSKLCRFLIKSDVFMCKMFAKHCFIARQESTQANSGQLGTQLTSPSLTEEQRVPAQVSICPYVHPSVHPYGLLLGDN